MTANERLRDSAISHAVDLSRYSNGVVRRMIALTTRVDADLMEQLILAIGKLPASTFTVERLDIVLAGVRAVNAQAHFDMGQALRDELKSLTEYESGYQYKLMREVVPSVIPVAQITAELAYTAAMARPFQGRLLSEWAQSIEDDRMARVRDTVRIGYVEGQTIDQMVTKLRGTRAKGYSDGLLEIDRRSAESVIRTAIGHTAGVTRERFNKANGDLIKALVWTSTLDSRTSEICRVRDGKSYTNDTHKPIGHSIPWLSGPGKSHWGCRSCDVAVTKSYRDLGININEIPASDRASMDGAVPAETTYGEWLNAQSAARQDEIVGPTRGRLMRQGGLTMDKFTNDKGVWLTLDQLKARDAMAFTKAGV